MKTLVIILSIFSFLYADNIEIKKFKKFNTRYLSSVVYNGPTKKYQ